LPQIANLLSPHFSVIAHIFYAMDLFRMLFANIYHYAGRSDSLGIISMDSRSGSSAGTETATGSSARNVTQAAPKQIPASGGKRVADQVIG
jgi:hypothetical protein